MPKKPDPKDWEHFQLRRVVGAPPNCVLLRGLGIPTSNSVLILMEPLSEQHRTEVTIPSRFPLTEREQEIILCLAQGMTNKQIGVRLNLSVYTVKDHLKNVMKKTRATSRAGVLACVGFFPERKGKPVGSRW